MGRGRSWVVLVVWVVVAVGGFALGSAVFGRLNGSVGVAPGSESDRAAARLADLDAASGAGGSSVTAVIAGRPAADPRLAAEVTAAAARIRALPGVAAVWDPYTPPGLVPPARDGNAVLVRVDLAEEKAVAAKGAPPVEETARQAAAIVHDTVHAPTVRVGGGPLMDEEMRDQAQEDLNRAEMFSLPVVLLLLVVVFGGLLAAGLPLLIALVGIASTFLVLYGFSLVTEVSVYAVQVTTMLGLGLAVDYALLIVTRFREERAAQAAAGTAGADPVSEAVRRTTATAGRTVLVSGLTVSAGLAGLLVFPDPFLRGIGMAGAAVVAIDMVAALTLLPALLRLFGHRIPLPRGAHRDGTAREGRVFAAVARLVGRRPLPVLLLVAVGLTVLAAPAAGLRLSGGDARSLPASSPSRQVFETVRDDFGAQYVADPVTVLARTAPGRALDAAALDRLGAAVAGLDRVAQVTRRQASADTVVFGLRVDLPAGAASDGSAAQRVVRGVRDLADRSDLRAAGLDVQVTGPAARLVDYHAMLWQRLPYAAGVIVVATLLLLFAFTGSVLVPLKAVLSNTLAVAASLGVVVWTFQDGHVFEGLGAVDATAPVLVAAIAFGLSMDYEVFLLSRIREAWLHDGDAHEAVATGLRRTGRVVTGAALLLVVVFAAFTTGGFSPVRQIGLGLALAIVLDATVVRMLAVPAAMTLLGRAAWWAPRRMRDWHARWGISEEPAAATTHPAGATRVEHAPVGGVRREPSTAGSSS
ncbi:MMPL family transporter [Yinghuangia seranimata]|uniref:MMPL family transporter n=1 Tax=Yinghuangia seranimata TaxID=408067 RepID=UPI00248BE473|nr:MMPL family transporter [Yinghuangia seranimata]MDI2127768.1 MMPL family transporter [Yinghuangia seranimata]